MLEYLKPKSYYEDLYDKLTVEECKSLEKRLVKSFNENVERYKGEKDKKEYLRVTSLTINLSFYFIKGERWEKKEKIIKEWISRDEVKQNKLDNTALIMDVWCLECDKEMKIFSKDLYDNNENNLRVLFMYECSDCKSRKAYYDDSEEYKSKDTYCLKCNSIMQEESKRMKNKIVHKYNCQCGYSYKDELDLTIKKENVEWRKYRLKYCLTQKQGEEYEQGKVRMEQLDELMKEYEERDKNKHLYDAVKKINILNIVELKNTLNKKITINGYSDLDKNVIVGFTVQDNKDDRNEYQSKKELKRTINETLGKTNWRLMSDGINYRLGVLSGKLKGIEGEEDLLLLIKVRKKLSN